MALLFAVLLSVQGGKIQWRDGAELDAALQEAALTGTPVIAYFTADW